MRRSASTAYEENHVRQALAQALQATGLIVVGSGLVIGLTRDDLRTEFLLMLLGGALFVVGRLIGRK